MTINLSPRADVTENSRAAITLIFVGGYLCQGIAQHFCLINQPLNNFFKMGLHLDAVRVSLCISILMLPWVIKPIYGLLSDSGQFAKAGRSRSLFLIWVHLIGALAYCALAVLLFALSHPPPAWSVFPVVVLVSLAGVCIAFATVVFVAMTVERAHLAESARVYFGIQALAYSAANIAAVFVGGQLCARLGAAAALAWGLVLASAALVCLAIAIYPLRERDYAKSELHSKREQPGVSHTAASAEMKVPLIVRTKALATDRTFLVTLLFLTLWNLSPNLGVSLYFYECDKLKFSQALIGTLAACTSVGTLVGSVVFCYGLAEYFSKRRSTYLLILLGVASTLSYTLLSSPLSGIVIEFFRGLITMVATLAIYGLAADVSPRGLTATAMAIQIAVFNLASEGSIALGGFLYGRVFAKELLPLIVVSSLTTLLTVALVPFLGGEGHKKEIESVS